MTGRRGKKQSSEASIDLDYCLGQIKKKLSGIYGRFVAAGKDLSKPAIGVTNSISILTSILSILRKRLRISSVLRKND